MLRLRNFIPTDGEPVASWVTDERTLRIWAAATYPRFPVAAAEINHRYEALRGSISSFHALMAEEDGVPVGHMILHYLDPEQTVVHFGYVIVDPACRGRGIGSRMLRQALDMAFGEMQAQRVSLMVLDCNARAHQCYRKLGFRDVPDTTETMRIQETEWVRHRMELTNG